MKKLVMVLAVGAVLSVPFRPAAAVPDEYDGSQAHPLRVAAYLIHPIGYVAEWLIFRPFHYLVSLPQTEKAFGHRPHGRSRAF